MMMWAGGWVCGAVFGVTTGIVIVSVILILIDKGK
jgi:hypothetical protein